jgi:murein DD-endopeptidase MepM/ murein hydrolase activator NlpD
MNADDFNKAELIAGRITPAHLTHLVRFYQMRSGLTADGMLGPDTRATLQAGMQKPALSAARFLHSPMPRLPDGRTAKITSAFRPADRPNHNGIDLFYAWADGDRPSHIGDKGCAGKRPDGKPRWGVPYYTNAIAAWSGRVQIAGASPTGYRLWIDHGNGYRTGYFHLLDLKVAVGDQVSVGSALGSIGDNPADNDGRHLHFELSPVDRYAPIDPAPFFL